MQRSAREQHLQYIYNPLSHTRHPSPWRSIIIKLFPWQPYPPISKHPFHKTVNVRGTHMVYPTLTSHIAMRVTICYCICMWYYISIISNIKPKMYINAHELLSSYPTRYEAAPLYQTNNWCIWMHLNSFLHTQQGMKLHRYAQ